MLILIEDLLKEHHLFERKYMKRHFTLEYGIDYGWFVGKLKEIPWVFSQGETLEELEENIKDAHHLMMAEDKKPQRTDIRTKELEIEVWNVATS